MQLPQVAVIHVYHLAVVVCIGKAAPRVKLREEMAVDPRAKPVGSLPCSPVSVWLLLGCVPRGEAPKGSERNHVSDTDRRFAPFLGFKRLVSTPSI